MVAEEIVAVSGDEECKFEWTCQLEGAQYVEKK